ncbi:hypothetical protein [uncultured Dokdonia sp.]|uniref:hypothetical protein n=1 Tax=uncultured Dokdonia sp. TaxID=575653 RepID=UPI0030EBB7C2|tara:strand:- start:20320 stop:21381 length:1062 start_codon:yes stop_codon:yes gene_type:complete
MTRKFKVDNYNEALPSYVKNNELSLSTRLIAKHYLDEQAEKYNWIELEIENFRFFNRLDNSRYFRYKPQYKPPYTESKKGFSNTLARALAKACLDKHERVSFFDDFDSYYATSGKKKYAFKNQNIVTSKINKKERGPDLICKDSSGEFVIVECKGRLSPYSEKNLNGFITQSNNAQVKDINGYIYQTKHFAVPFYISFNNDSSSLSIVDPPNEGKSAQDDNINLIERKHYSRVLQNLGYSELAFQLLEKQKEVSDSKFEIQVVTTNIDNNQYVVPEHLFDLFDFFPFYNQYIYCLELSRFRQLKEIIQNPYTNFKNFYLENNFKNNEDNIHLSNDGSFLIRRSEIREIRKIQI